LSLKLISRAPISALKPEFKVMPERKANEQTVLNRIQTEMNRHLLEHDAPEEIIGFLLQHWSRLLTGIFIAKGNQHADWLAGWDTVNALLWSLAPKSSRSETEIMLHMLPTLLARMHEGCLALSIPFPERDLLFARLAMMHAAVARAGLRCHDEPETAVTHLAAVPGLESEADLAGLTPPKNIPIEIDTAPDAGMSLPKLKIGDRVRFRQHDQTKILHLNWISPAGGMYLFGNEQGLDAMTLTRARLAERFAQGLASLVSG